MTNKEKGDAGEERVSKIIEKVIADNPNIRLFKNVILEYRSIYGPKSMMTTELDQIIVMRAGIIIVEVKNEEYLEWDLGNRYEVEIWHLKNREEVSNPIQQNKYHKDIFCKLFNIPKENVVTVECLLKCSRLPRHIRNNDYVLGEDNFEKNLTLLLGDNGRYPTQDYDYLSEMLVKLERDSEGKRDRHIRNLETVDYIKRKIGKYIGLPRLTDIAICPDCGGYIYFKEANFVRPGNERKSRQVIASCSNYIYPDQGCRRAYYREDREGKNFKDMKIISMEEPNEMEEHRTTVLDDYYRLVEENKELRKHVRDDRWDYEAQIRRLENRPYFEREENKRLEGELKAAHEKIDSLESTLEAFTPVLIFGKSTGLFIQKEKYEK